MTNMFNFISIVHIFQHPQLCVYYNRNWLVMWYPFICKFMINNSLMIAIYFCFKILVIIQKNSANRNRKVFQYASKKNHTNECFQFFYNRLDSFWNPLFFLLVQQRIHRNSYLFRDFNQRKFWYFIYRWILPIKWIHIYIIQLTISTFSFKFVCLFFHVILVGWSLCKMPE